MPSETVSDGIFIVINKNQDKATRAATVQIVRQGEGSTDSTEPIHLVLQHLRESFSWS
ncbi:hypothetical protein [Neisseria meningitidis]|uniref:hypothetical protein n=1 Tax=Neisseria meningitidis TaxID=487 RepID=UPI000AE30C87|nr:hypothetical protein [Neisseria meningitidis]